MNVLVAGGTGFIGRNLCAKLDGRGHEVTALSRNPDPSVVPNSVRSVSGDATEYGEVSAAVEGQDCIVNLVSLSPLYKPSGGLTHEGVHLGATRTLVDAAEDYEVDRFVQMSGLGADPDGPTAFIRAKGRAETVVRESNLDWVIFRPSVVFGDGGEFVSFTKTLTTPYVTGLPGGGRTRFQPIWVGDLASMLADAVEDDRHLGEIYEIGGPEVLTLAEVAKLAHRADGRPVKVIPVPMILAKVGMAIAERIPFVPFGLDQYRSLQFDNTTETNDVEEFGYRDEELRTLQSHLGLE